MYLKSLEMVGFKSFADKTKLHFEPGMTCIVGPNGCGKSNVADAIRWVLGEQKPTALRSAQMTDCIFNGTESRKPLGMAEVNITFADCEKLLQMEYAEVTVTRRVFGSGEGQYFINKTPCRLKDVQRLFMDTGIGTASYSFMAQGRIDQILSSRPEDRRTIFEEASGITKYKSDKKEAIRKLEHTEANLIRLSDVIREVKRQIGSLQRQAGKARRYRTMKDELRGLDIFATKSRLTEVDRVIRKEEGRIKEKIDLIAKGHKEVEAFEQANLHFRQVISNIDNEIGSTMEFSASAQNKLDRTHDMMRTNIQRIEEYETWANRDSVEVNSIEQQITSKKTEFTSLSSQIETARTALLTSEDELKKATDKFTQHRNSIDSARSRIQQLRDESFQLDSLSSRLQNEMLELESQQRTSVIERERLTAEKSHLSGISESHGERLKELIEVLKKLEEEVNSVRQNLKTAEEKQVTISGDMQECRQKRADLQRTTAARETKIELLSDSNEVEDDFPPGARLLLNENNPLNIDKSNVLGALASLIDSDPEYSTALEASLRSMLDAVIIRDSDAAFSIIDTIQKGGKGSARLLSLNPPSPAVAVSLRDTSKPLIECVKCNAEVQPLIKYLLHNVFLVDAIPNESSAIPSETIYVTREGVLAGHGRIEFWMNDAGSSNPLSRKHAITEAEAEISELRNQLKNEENCLTSLSVSLEEINLSIVDYRNALDTANRALAQKEGEKQIVSSESKTAAARLETVTWELNQLSGMEKWDSQRNELSQKQSETRTRKEEIVTQISSQNKELDTLEHRHSELQGDVTEHRIKNANLTQRVEHIEVQYESVKQRVRELENTAKGRSEGILSYKTNIQNLQKENETAKEKLPELETTVSESASKASKLRSSRDAKKAELERSEQNLSSGRNKLEEVVQQRSEIELRCTENKMRRQNQIERVTSDYNLSIEEVMDFADPDWDKNELSLDECETRVAELKAKLEAMGPVNLVAIEEYKEHEERYAFLTKQEDDLVNSKKQLLEMIKKINETTSEMFQSTFTLANDNFQEMFKRLFNGGTAKLVLVNEEDVLDCGIEIIARPPGKRLQSISLLSGGERTLTAVALLFAIYMIKPSPFCLLDELDAPLDDSNIGRFTEILKEFVKQSQFVVITHNRQTIASGQVLYGVTMPERGVSKIMSMKFKDAKGGVFVEEGQSTDKQ